MNLLNDVKTVCALLSISRTHLYEEIKRGRLSPVKSGNKTLFHRDELERYAASLHSPAALNAKAPLRLDATLIAGGDASAD